LNLLLPLPSLFFPPLLGNELRRKEISRLFDGEPRSAALAVGALALKDVGAVCPVLLAAVSAPQHVNVLVMVCAGEVRTPDSDLSVPGPVACFGRPFTYRGQFTYTGSEVLNLLVPQSRLKPSQADALSSMVLFPSR
jgi:hypothetical protein